MSELSRRHALAGAAVAGVALPLLAACGSSDGTNGNPASGANGPKKGSILGKESAVPVGGGVIYPDESTVVTQPKAGIFRGFSAICTHEGCMVGDVSNGTINCPCHFSRFSIDDGHVVSGPATLPLPEVNIQVKNGNVETD